MTSLRAPIAALLLTAAGSLACADQQQAPSDAKVEAKAEAPADGAKSGEGEVSDPNALSEEDLRLIKADPETLTPEENRKRGHALRRQVMQNPNSANAAALEDARQAVLAGEVDPKTIGAGGSSEPQESKDEKLVIELPDHLKNPDGTPKSGNVEGTPEPAPE